MVRKMFAGGNSARGFYSFFDQMFSDNIEQIFLLKGAWHGQVTPNEEPC